MIRRPPRSTLSSSSAASDVYKRQPYSNRVLMRKIEGLSRKMASGDRTQEVVLDLVEQDNNINSKNKTSATTATAKSSLPPAVIAVKKRGRGRPIGKKGSGSTTTTPGAVPPATTLSPRDAAANNLSLIHISEPTRLLSISYAVFCLKKKKKV
eukprot:TRINITY_DN38674_c0_g1_i1.p1 TRINITY_DN38674_c0_g1~~TRINITY_DN38674_c0_g1_i1.p1  ORF type:complete len:153 (-),score=36.91 TRINITY_DN38674_c0_g1_i1:84-542(-)